MLENKKGKCMITIFQACIIYKTNGNNLNREKMSCVIFEKKWKKSAFGVIVILEKK